METLRRVDANILQLVTKLAHGVQTWTGKSNFFLAKVAVVYSLAALALDAALYWYPALVPFAQANLFSVCTTPLAAAGLVLLYFMAHEAEQSLGDTVLPPFLSALHERGPVLVAFSVVSAMCGCFILALNFCTLVLGHYAFNVWLYALLRGTTSHGFLAVLYLMAVTPLPPGRGKIREWLSSWGSVTQLQPVEQS